ncbi:MAG: DUF523 and DUF1722 domain-containing protein [Methanomicrobiales archaeon]|nr:DUF523 and DUF1722 domain-containing protein [Methanomicrobiales archaeon]
MRAFIQPRILVSRCIEYEACRYNGGMVSNETVQRLKSYAEMFPVCPEVEIGLGVPRNPVRLVKHQMETQLVQSNTGKDVTDEIGMFADRFLKSLPVIDGIIMKSGSPSCGLADVSIHTISDDVKPRMKGRGLFAEKMQTWYPSLPKIDERDLTDLRLRDHFLTQIFTLAEFQAVKNHEITKNLLQFHAENKYLLTAHHRKEYAILTALATNTEGRSFDVVMKEYHDHLLQTLARPARVTSHILVLRHAISHFTGALPAKDRQRFENIIDTYRRGDGPLSDTRNLIREWIVRYDEDYLGQQTYFEPYPSDLEIVSGP